MTQKLPNNIFSTFG